MRQIADGLHSLLINGGFQLVQQQRQNDGSRERENQTVNVQQQRVPNNLPEVRVVQVLLEVLETHPRAALNAHADIVLLERDLHAVHGPVAEQNIEGNGDHQHQIQMTVLPNLRPYAVVPMRVSIDHLGRRHKVFLLFMLDVRRKSFACRIPHIHKNASQETGFLAFRMHI